MLDEVIFRFIILCNMIVLVADVIAWSTDGCKFLGARLVALISNSTYYILTGVVLFLSAVYITTRLSEKHTIEKKWLITFSIPILIETIMILLSPYTHWYFYIDSENMYHRGSLYLVQAVIGLGYIIYAYVYTIIKMIRTNQATRKRECHIILGFILLPFITSLLQAKFYGLPLIWIGTTISILMFFVSAQNSQLSLDALTGLNNRGKLDIYLEEKVNSHKPNTYLYVIVLDIDKFKDINDKYGHVEGDNALTALAKILHKTCENGKDFVARYGGDEFTLVCVRKGTDDINPLLSRLNELIDQYNRISNKPYSLSVSYGYAKLDGTKEKSVEDLKREADHHMYMHKQKKQIP